MIRIKSLTLGVLLICASVTCAFAFDVAAYKDPRSEARISSHWNTYLGNCEPPSNEEDYAVWVANTAAANREAMRLYEEMGLTQLMVYYKNEDFRHLEDVPFTVMNDLAPGHAFKYLTAFYRGVKLAVEDSVHNFGMLNWGEDTDTLNIADVIELGDVQKALRITPDSGAGDFWKPYPFDWAHAWSWSTFGEWNGWTQRGCPDSTDWQGNIMPFHFKLKCKIELDPEDTTNTHVATLYWYVEDPWSPNLPMHLDEQPRARDYDPVYARYPGIKIFTSDSAFNTESGVFSDWIFTLRPDSFHTRYTREPERFTDSLFRLCDTNLEVIPGFEPPYISDYDEFSSGGTSWAGQSRVLFKIEYTGHHTFMAYSFDVWDEGYHRLFLAEPDTIAFYKHQIQEAYETQYNLAGGKLTNWYYDEFSNDAIKAFVRVNSYLQEAGLPLYNLNGWNGRYDGRGTGDSILLEASDKGVNLPVMMMECYPYSIDSTCVPVAWQSTGIEGYVDPSSDVDYYRYSGDQCWPWDHWRYGETEGFFNPGISVMSLQASLDQMVWGGLAFRQSQGIGTHLDPGEHFRGFAEECKFNHDHGLKAWSLLQSGETRFFSADTGLAFTRKPSPNEIKLEAWLSVASDADGIMWYSGMSTVRGGAGAGNWGGLLDWGADSLHVAYDMNFCDGTPTVHGTPNYYAAKKVCNEIHEIAPTLEALEFGGTTASRIFETEYQYLDDSLKIDLDHWIPCGESQAESSIGAISAMYWDSSESEWVRDNNSYVQLSYWKGLNQSSTDMWFLLVNRRGLPSETRKIVLDLFGLEETVDYYAEYSLSDSMVQTNVLPYGFGNACSGAADHGRRIEAIIAPGEAELVHFFVLDTADLVLTGPNTLKAPAYYNRNIILDSAQVTIEPDTALQRYQVIKGNQTQQEWKDSLEILFAPGKGITLKWQPDGYNKLGVLGNDSTKIVMKCAKGGDFKWAGITVEGPHRRDTLLLKNTVISDAKFGVKENRGRGFTKIEDSEFRDCGYALYAVGARKLVLDDTEFRKNYGKNAILLTEGVQAHVNGCNIHDNVGGSLTFLNSCTVSLNNSIVRNNAKGLSALDSDLRVKCSDISSNKANGIFMLGGSLVMADTSLTTQHYWGASTVNNNGMQEVFVVNPRAIVMANGENSFFDSTSGERNPVMIEQSGNAIPINFSYVNNHWGTLTDTTLIRARLLPPYGVSPIDPQFSRCNWSQTPEDEDDDLQCFVGANQKEVDLDFTAAKQSYKDLIETASESCRKGSSVQRLVSVNFASGVAADSTLSYLNDVKESTSDVSLTHDLNLSISHVLAIEGQIDSARTVLDSVIAQAGDTLSRLVEGQAALLSLGILEEQADTIDGLTVEELTEYLDSLDQIVGQLSQWTQYEITDSVVMYAPTRVDSVINVRGDGVLTILPHPGYKNPVIEFVNQGAINVYGTDTTKTKGKLYVYGEPDSRIMLHWEDSTGTKNVYSERGLVKMKHADFHGNGFVNLTQDLSGSFQGQRRATFQADSCTFSWFDEGVMVRATDTTSYMRACTLSHMGGGGLYYTGLGAGLILLKADGFVVEDCVFESNDGVGIYHALAYDVSIRNSIFRNSAKYGIYGASSGGGDARLECCTVESNGDTLPELYTVGVIYDLVGAHNSFADSTGSLIKSTDPSYVDLENGENYFEVWDDGRYLQSGDTNDTWDITWNTWSPAMPGDSNFYDYLWPATPAKWTVDSSLTEFLTCGESAASSIGGGNWLVVEDGEEVSGTMSAGNDNQTDAVSFARKDVKSTLQKQTAVKSKKSSLDYASKNAGSAFAVRKQTRADKLERHNRELAAWRAVRNIEKGSGSARAAMQFLVDNQGSEFTPAALGVITSAARNGSALQASTYLMKFADDSKDRSLKRLAQRLSWQALANEGKPAEGLSGLENMMTSATTPRDSVLALMDAMQVYFDFNHTGTLQAKHPQVMVTDPYDLVRKTLMLVQRLDDPTLGVSDNEPALPTKYALYQNYPNPFNPSTEIRFDLPEAIRVELKIFNILGQEVATLVDDIRSAGAYQILWDGKNAGGLSVASGVYVYQIKAGNFQDAKKMVLLR